MIVSCMIQRMIKLLMVLLFQIFKVVLIKSLVFCITVLPSSKPSPSKRRCSEENAVGEENKEPATLQVTASEPAKDKNPTTAPSSVHSAKVERLPLHSSLDSGKGPAHPLPDTEKIEACPSQTRTGCTDKMKHSMMAESSEDLKGTPAATPTASNMRSRLQRLAEQRHYWDSEGRPESVSSSMICLPYLVRKLAC